MKKFLLIILSVIVLLSVSLTGCTEMSNGGIEADVDGTIQAGNNLSTNQPTPTDIDYSLERYNLIRRAYWVNGQREKAMSLPCAITRPLGYIVLITESGAILGSFVVDGKVSSLNSFLTPSMIQEYIANGGVQETELPDIDGSYGVNDNGIFFFTPDGKYIEWTGTYLYSDIPFTVDDPVLKTE